jgi:tRNA U38,U39,U40 pseudouridine synthase TruA
MIQIFSFLIYIWMETRNIGLMIPIVKGLCDADVIEKAFNPERKYPTPLAPGLGLMLVKV